MLPLLRGTDECNGVDAAPVETESSAAASEAENGTGPSKTVDEVAAEARRKLLLAQDGSLMGNYRAPRPGLPPFRGGGGGPPLRLRPPFGPRGIPLGPRGPVPHFPRPDFFGPHVEPFDEFGGEYLECDEFGVPFEGEFGEFCGPDGMGHGPVFGPRGFPPRGHPLFRGARGVGPRHGGPPHLFMDEGGFIEGPFGGVVSR